VILCPFSKGFPYTLFAVSLPTCLDIGDFLGCLRGLGFLAGFGFMGGLSVVKFLVILEVSIADWAALRIYSAKPSISYVDKLLDGVAESDFSYMDNAIME